MLKTDRKERIGLLLGRASQDHVRDKGLVEQALEFRLEHRPLTGFTWSKEKLGILLAVDQLAL
jgi:hypothetical protein